MSQLSCDRAISAAPPLLTTAWFSAETQAIFSRHGLTDAKHWPKGLLQFSKGLSLAPAGIALLGSNWTEGSAPATQVPINEAHALPSLPWPSHHSSVLRRHVFLKASFLLQFTLH